jgi:hypothetical protein
MDFMNRGGQGRAGGAAGNSGGAPAPVQTPVATGNTAVSHTKWTRVGFLTLLFAGTLLVIATLLFLALGKGAYRESKFVAKDQLQAVFINVNGTNGGQVYFGNIREMTSNYIRLSNVFYIQNQQSGTQQNASTAYNLVKLGCELHGPTDEMMINRSEVFFWENLKSDSQVAQKVAEFHKQNPEGQKCNNAEQSQSTDQQSANTQPSGTTTPAPAPAPAPAPNGGTTTTRQNTTTTPTPTPAPATNTNR